MSWREISRLARREDGVAMITVIVLGAIIVLVLSTIAVRNMSDLNQVRDDRLREQALHTGDAGVDQTVALLTQNRYYSSTATGGDPFPTEAADEQGGSYDPAVEKAWVLEQANAMSTKPGPEGEWVVVKPQGPTPTNPATDPKDQGADCPIEDWPNIHPTCVIYSVGYTPTRSFDGNGNLAGDVRVRVIRAEYGLGPFFVPQIAVTSGGKLDLNGNVTIKGSDVNGTHTGSGYAYGSVDVGGNVHFEGFLAAREDCQTDCPSHADDEPTGGGIEPDQVGMPPTLPPINPRQAYSSSEFDLCPDRTVRAGPSHSDSPPPEGTTQPCTSAATILHEDAGVTRYRGWKHAGSDASQGAKWTYEKGNGVLDGCDTDDGFANNECDGVVYVYHGSVSVDGGGKKADPWRVTILAEADPTSGVEHEAHCPHIAGDIVFSGNPWMHSHEKGKPLLLAAGRDLVISGGAQLGEFDHEGAIAAHEQIKMTGTPQIKGPVIANDACAGSPSLLDDLNSESGIFRPLLSGNVTIEYHVLVGLPFGTEVHLPNWTEL